MPRRWVGGSRRRSLARAPGGCGPHGARLHRASSTSRPRRAPSASPTTDSRPRTALAAWKAAGARGVARRARRPVDTDGAVADLGAERTVEAVVALGSSTADDVEVQLLHGPVGQHDELVEPRRGRAMASRRSRPTTATLRYPGSFRCDTAGRYGVHGAGRAVHPDLVTPVELGRSPGPEPAAVTRARASGWTAMAVGAPHEKRGRAARATRSRGRCGAGGGGAAGARWAGRWAAAAAGGVQAARPAHGLRRRRAAKTLSVGASCSDRTIAMATAPAPTSDHLGDRARRRRLSSPAETDEASETWSYAATGATSRPHQRPRSAPSRAAQAMTQQHPVLERRRRHRRGRTRRRPTGSAAGGDEAVRARDEPAADRPARHPATTGQRASAFVA